MFIVSLTLESSRFNTILLSNWIICWQKLTKEVFEAFVLHVCRVLSGVMYYNDTPLDIVCQIMIHILILGKNLIYIKILNLWTFEIDKLRQMYLLHLSDKGIQMVNPTKSNKDKHVNFPLIVSIETSIITYNIFKS